MKTSLICLAIALAFRLAFSQTVEVLSDIGQYDDKYWKHAARQIFIVGGDPAQRWLTIIRFDTKAPDEDQHGFSPNYTYAVCKYKPVIKKLPHGEWQISFISEITEKNGGIP